MKSKEIKKMLVMRFSAMGDVAMTVPVLSILAKQNPQLRITVITRPRLVPLFEWAPANVMVQGIDLDKYDGITGLTKLFNELRKADYDAVADLHDVLRTKYIRTCFRMAGTRVAVIDKDRKHKKQLIGHGVDGESMTPMVERYAKVFRELSSDIHLDINAAEFDLRKEMRGENFMPINAFAGKKAEGERWIGIAPFAAHETKVYPLSQMRNVAQQLSERGYKVFLFGAGPTETVELESWECDGILSVCGKLGGLKQEMLLMSRLNLMIAMDSANMHIAAMLSVPVLGIWGATHPKTGFNGWRLTDRNVLHLPDLDCRPCSVYGNKPCLHGDHRCMTGITVEMIVQKAESLIR